MTVASDNIVPVGGMELLAPAGSRAAFEAAVRAGADAVYAGAPGLNARNLTRDFTLKEIDVMCREAHSNGVKLYIAMNSLMRQEEIETAVEMLAHFAAAGIDALIVQDLGVLHLAREYFPELRLHASTLLGGHNSMTVGQFADLGFSRVVLARELSLAEIRSIHRTMRGRINAELEVFVQGALCFSFSGLCLCSSYLGGKSSMRGRCVQPCRRRYQWQDTHGRLGKGKRHGAGDYLFSMNDLCAVELLPELQRAGVTSLKIEGRLRSAQYVENVVKAYRLALDGLAMGEKAWAKALAQSVELLGQAMGRNTTKGYFHTARPSDIISVHHSGNIGLFLGRIEAGRGKARARLTLRHDVAAGDRLRLHREQDGERIAFTLKGMRKEGKTAERAAAGEAVFLEIPAPVRPGDSLYKVDTREGRAREAEIKTGPVKRRKTRTGTPAEIQNRIRTVLRDLQQPTAPAGRASRPSGRTRDRRPLPRTKLEIWLQSDDPGILRLDLPMMPDRLLLHLDKESFAAFNRQRRLPVDLEKRITWVLPPVIREREIAFFPKAIEQLSRRGFRAFQLGHVGQRGFFGRTRRFFLTGDYTLNVANCQAALLLRELSMQRLQLTIEADRNLISALGGACPGLGLTVYGTPPLFTSWLTGGHLKDKRTLASPKGEEYVIRRAGGFTHLLARHPFSLLPLLPELEAMGVGYVVIDVGHGRPAREIREVLATLTKGGPWKGRLSTFNYSGSYQ